MIVLRFCKTGAPLRQWHTIHSDTKAVISLVRVHLVLSTCVVGKWERCIAWGI